MKLSFSDLSSIPFEEVKNKKELQDLGKLDEKARENDFTGMNNLYLLKGDYKGKPVFIKFVNKKSSLNQIRLMKVLEKEKVGPKLLGFTEDEKGSLGIVTEFIPGIEFTLFTSSIPKSINLSMSTYRQVQKIRKTLVDLGLVYGNDVQIRITPEGNAFLIDPEWLSFTKPREEDSTPLQEMDEILRVMKNMLKRRGQWKE